MSPLQFLSEVRQEASKVTWPTWKEVWVMTLWVVIMVALASLFFAGVDLILGFLVSRVLDIGHG